MWENILTSALNNGLWAALFVALMVYILRDMDKREKKYEKLIDDLSGSLRIVADIKCVVRDIQKEISDIKLEVYKKK